MKRNLGDIQYTVLCGTRSVVANRKRRCLFNLLLRELMNQGRLNDKDGRLLTELVYGTISRQLYWIIIWIGLLKMPARSTRGSKRCCGFPCIRCCISIKYPPMPSFMKPWISRKPKAIRELENSSMACCARSNDKECQTWHWSKDNGTFSNEISLPLWLTKLVKQIGIEETSELGYAYLNNHASGRIDLQRISQAAALQEEGIDATKWAFPLWGCGWQRLYGGLVPLQKVLLTIKMKFDAGCPRLQVARDHQVLDACAAPGGKTTHIAAFLSCRRGRQKWQHWISMPIG